MYTILPHGINLYPALTATHLKLAPLGLQEGAVTCKSKTAFNVKCLMSEKHTTVYRTCWKSLTKHKKLN